MLFSSFINIYNKVTRVGFIDSKIELERHVKQQGLPFTIVRCALYMENLESQITSAIKNKIEGNFQPNAKIPYIALEDIGSCVTEIFNHPEKYKSKTVDLVGVLCQVMRSLMSSIKYLEVTLLFLSRHQS